MDYNIWSNIYVLSTDQWIILFLHSINLGMYIFLINNFIESFICIIIYIYTDQEGRKTATVPRSEERKIHTVPRYEGRKILQSVVGIACKFHHSHTVI